MRRISLKTITLPGIAALYRTCDLLNEFVWGLPIWSADEAYRATYKRCSELLSASTREFEDVSEQDFEKLTNVLKQLDFAEVLPSGQARVRPALTRPLRQAVNDLLDSEVVDEKSNGAKPGSENETKAEPSKGSRPKTV
jgi:hypothetical protein